MSEFIKGFKTQDGSVKKYDFNSLGNTPEIVTKEEVDQIVADALEQAGGIEGPQGPQGEQGPAGQSAYQLALDKGFEGTEEEWLESLKGEDGAPGGQGPEGPEGPKGDTGATPDFSIGEVNTLAPGSKATASITGTPEAPVLNLGIPRGADGSGGSGGTGEDGEDGGYYTPQVDDEGYLTWIGSKTDMPDIESGSIKGPKGDQGEKGDQGPAGEKGEQGQEGPEGPIGPDGAPGVTFIPHVDAQGNLSWTNDGDLPNPSMVNIMGPQGPQGPAGSGGSGEGVELDTTLTQAGKAADAKATGDVISELADNVAYTGDESVDASVPLNADTLGGKDISYFAQKSDIKPKAGFIYPLATPNVPDGFLLCDGKAYGRTEYVELFAAIGTYYGEGDGSTTFNVPNLQTRVPVGAGNGYELGSVGGEAEHTLTVGEMPNHTHDVRVKWHDDAASVNTAHANGVVVNVTNDVAGHLAVDRSGGTGTYGAGGNQPHNNMQPYTVINYIISTGKESAVYIRDVINGAQAIPLEIQYGGTGATTVYDARKNLGVKDYKRNLLDNSDFRNPVNQRGQTSYTGASVYSIDRWKVGNTVIVGKVVLGENGATLSYDEDYCDFHQNLEHYEKMKGKVYTIAYMDGYGNVYVSPFTMGAHTGSQTWIDFGKVKFMSIDGMNILFRAYETETIQWAALYEGSYTAETLPPYVPKGYGAELAECQRYYQRFESKNTASNSFAIGVGILDGNKNGAYIGVDLVVPMRIKPTLLYENLEVWNGQIGHIALNNLQIFSANKENSKLALLAHFATVSTAYSVSLQTPNKSYGRIEFSAEL